MNFDPIVDDFSPVTADENSDESPLTEESDLHSSPPSATNLESQPTVLHSSPPNPANADVFDTLGYPTVVDPLQPIEIETPATTVIDPLQPIEIETPTTNEPKIEPKIGLACISPLFQHTKDKGFCEPVAGKENCSPSEEQVRLCDYENAPEDYFKIKEFFRECLNCHDDQMKEKLSNFMTLCQACDHQVCIWINSHGIQDGGSFGVGGTYTSAEHFFERILQPLIIKHSDQTVWVVASQCFASDFVKTLRTLMGNQRELFLNVEVFGIRQKGTEDTISNGSGHVHFNAWAHKNYGGTKAWQEYVQDTEIHLDTV